MTPHKQLHRHDPASGVYGDCFRTCIASVLDLEPAEVPHVFNRHHDSGDAGHDEMNAWLAERGLRLLWIAYQGDVEREKLLSILGTMNPGVPFMLSGESAPGVGHFVVCMDGKIIHDPSLTPTGSLAPHDDGLWHVFFIGRALPLGADGTAAARSAQDTALSPSPDRGEGWRPGWLAEDLSRAEARVSEMLGEEGAVSRSQPVSESVPLSVGEAQASAKEVGR